MNLSKLDLKSPVLAMACMPVQEWCEPYDADTALEEGTIFPCLNMCFFKAPYQMENLPVDKAACNEREACMTRLTTISFVLNDLTLYLDTHPNCEKGLDMYHSLMKERLELLAKYARNYNPLTQASVITGDCNPKEYGWGEGPAPWEGACI